MPYGRFVYEVERERIVAPTATWVTQRVGYDRLVLSACHPLYSRRQADRRVRPSGRYATPRRPARLTCQ